MHGPDGTDYPNKTIYLEVEEYSKLVYDHGANDDRAPLFRVTVLFSELKGKTKMEMSMALPTPEAAEETRKFIKKAGGEATWDRLAEYLEEELSGKKKFVINRSFDAPLEVMFKMWTNPKHFSKWLAPTGFEMEFIRSNIESGGSTFYFMAGNGFKMYGRAEYLKIEKPNQLVYTQQFCDENEKISRHPISPTWPETMLTTVTLTEEEANRIDRMEERGLVKRGTDIEDRRKVLISLSKKGKAIADKAIEKRLKLGSDSLKDFSSQELKTLENLLRKLM